MVKLRALAALLLFASSAWAREMTEDEFRWLLAQPANKVILSSTLSRDEKIERILAHPANIEKFGPTFADDFRATIVRMTSKGAGMTDGPSAAEARGGAGGGDSDQHAIMGAGVAPAKRTSGGTRSGKAARASTKNSAAAPVKKSKNAETRETPAAPEPKDAPAPAISAAAAPATAPAGVSSVAPMKPLAAGRSAAASGSSSGGGSGAPAASPAAPAGSGQGSGSSDPNQVLSVQCGATKNVLTWKLLAGRNSNSIIRNVDGADGEYVCGGPQNLGSCTGLNVATFEDMDVRPGKTYSYRQKSAPACASNTVTCPGGASSGESCLLGGVEGGGSGGSGGSGGGTGGSVPVDTHCTGGNPKCICVKDVARYDRYRTLAVNATRAAFPGRNGKPAGMSDQIATQRICEAYNADRALGPGSACRPHGDEVIFQDPNPPDRRYPTTSVDVITSSGGFWSSPIAACELGVQ